MVYLSACMAMILEAANALAVKQGKHHQVVGKRRLGREARQASSGVHEGGSVRDLGVAASSSPPRHRGGHRLGRRVVVSGALADCVCATVVRIGVQKGRDARLAIARVAQFE